MIPQTGLPTLCYIHPAVLRGMASTHTPSRTLRPGKPHKTKQMLEDIKLRVANLHRRIALMNVDDAEIEDMVNRVKGMTNVEEQDLRMGSSLLRDATKLA